MPAQVATIEDVQQMMAPISRTISYLMALVPKKVNTDQAAAIIGKSRDTLERMRKQKDCPVKFEYKGDRPMYDLFSLIAYCEKSGETPESIQKRLQAIQ